MQSDSSAPSVSSWSSYNSSTSYESSSSSRGNDISFDSDCELTNPEATDFDSIEVAFTNNSGRDVASVEKTGSHPQIELLSSTPTSITLKSVLGEIGPEGMGKVTVSFDFRDIDGNLITTASTSVGVMQTLIHAAKKDIDNVDLSGALSTDVNATFKTSATELGQQIQWSDPQAPVNVGLTAEAEINSEPFVLQARASAKAEFDMIQENFSVSFGARAVVTFPELSIGDIDWQLFGAANTTFSSTGQHSLKGSIGVQVLSVIPSLKEVNFRFEGILLGVWYENSFGRSEAENFTGFLGVQFSY